MILDDIYAPLHVDFPKRLESEEYKQKHQIFDAYTGEMSKASLEAITNIIGYLIYTISDENAEAATALQEKHRVHFTHARNSIVELLNNVIMATAMVIAGKVLMDYRDKPVEFDETAEADLNHILDELHAKVEQAQLHRFLDLLGLDADDLLGFDSPDETPVGDVGVEDSVLCDEETCTTCDSED
jgi:hypothetical protein